jgi:hypothetical protein
MRKIWTVTQTVFGVHASCFTSMRTLAVQFGFDSISFSTGIGSLQKFKYINITIHINILI